MYLGVNKTTSLLTLLNSGEIIFFVSDVVTAKEINVGGTSIFSKVPDIESFPPIDGTEKSNWAFNAPNNAANGLPHLFASSFNLSKNSWQESLTLL